ncbi:proton-translocating transhydrogenase family protein [Ponticaulis profundi]|uniref:proton-translocating NAD(P)(+) transhydrogenase n=1 Tax=Ponticaulis profundi TaxID=2665222 RepID=A0ABW1S657_9PROT
MKVINCAVALGMSCILAMPASASTGTEAINPAVYLAAVFALACFVGYYVVWSVTPALHTPLMSVTNAISGVVVVGAVMAAAATGMTAEGATTQDVWIARGIGTLALILASVNIFGGFLVTRRMLAMYKKKGK